MQTKEQVFLYMKDEIEGIAKKEEEKYLQEAKELEKQAYEEIKREASIDADNQLKKEMSEISSNASVEASASLEERTKKLVTKRDEYVSNVFSKAKDKLKEFVASDKYHDYLINAIKTASDEYQMDDAIIYLRSEDLALKDEVIKAYKLKVEVKDSGDITIGGFIINSKDASVVVDESLDFALENQKDWFYKTSGLMIK
ncbi:MAG: V-type ATP synthase subunit E [Thomasclavelia sp.]|jgi:V/A-type H+-transporting ATPase subunit E|nr:V-type ATP synthase subunit E [Thomasclavelia sp.]